MFDWKKHIISSDAKIKEVVAQLEKVKTDVIPTLFVLEGSKLLGSVEMTDVNRSLMSHDLDQDDSVMKVVHRNPAVLFENKELSLEDRLRYKNFKYLPIINDRNELVEIKCLANFESLTNYAVIFAGGLGSRLGRLTAKIPKPMLNVGGVPILETIIKQLKANNIRKIMISVNYKAEVIKEYFQDGRKFDVDIDYIEEKKKLGTVGSLSLVARDLSKPSFVINGDILSNLNYIELLNYHQKNDLAATMCVTNYEIDIPFGVIETNGNRLIGIEEKPVRKFLINAGIYVLNPDHINKIPHNTYYDMTHLFQKILDSNEKTGVYHLNDYWIDIGYQKQYQQAEKEYSIVHWD